ncbi:MAG: SH3 domain-containing protein [Ferruginibacter sp.]
MKVYITVLIACLVSSVGRAQSHYYAAAKNGLSMREQPDLNAKVLDKISYGQKLELINDTAGNKAISAEGFSGYWWLVKYNDKKGYVVSPYVLPSPPPDNSIKTLQDYFAQISSPNGNAIVIKEPVPAGEEGGSELKKQLYKNGMEWHETQGYEYGASLYILPGYTMEQAFLLIRLIGQYPDLINVKDAFPAKKIKTKTETAERSIEVEREIYDDGKQGPIKKIKITLVAGVITEFEIFIIDTQVFVSYSSGV